MTKIAIILGGDLGNEPEIFDRAAAELARAGVRSLRRSRLWRSAPADCVPGTPDFSDQALTGEWAGSAAELLALGQRLERGAGRPACHSSREARTLDVDLILFGDEVISTAELVIPHPRARQRDFVLGPLAEIAPAWRFPDTGETVLEAWRRLLADGAALTGAHPGESR